MSRGRGRREREFRASLSLLLPKDMFMNSLCCVRFRAWALGGQGWTPEKSWRGFPAFRDPGSYSCRLWRRCALPACGCPLPGSMLIANSAILWLPSKWLAGTRDSVPKPSHGNPLFHYLPDTWLEMRVALRIKIQRGSFGAACCPCPPGPRLGREALLETEPHKWGT